MTTLTPEDRARLRDLAAKATPGPWTVEHGSDWDLDGSQVPQSSVRRADRAAITWDDHGGEVFKPADAEFIAAMRNALPALLDALDEAEAAVQRMREMHEPIPVTEYITACSCGWWSHDDCPHVRALDGDA